MHVQTIVPSLKLLSFKQFFFGRVFLSNTTRFVFRVGHRLLAERLALDVDTPDGVLFGLLAWCKLLSLLILAYLSIE